MALELWERQHNSILDEINSFALVSPAEVAKAQYLYTQARIQAYKIAGHYRAEQKKHEASAEIQQGLGYKKIRRGEVKEYEDMKASTDAQYLSRITKGKELAKAAEAEGLYITWNGIANTYESAANALKDVLKSMYSDGA